MFTSHEKNVWKNRDKREHINAWKNVVKFKYLGTIVTHEDCTLNSESGCYHWVQNLLSSRLLYSNLKIQIYRTIFYRLF